MADILLNNELEKELRKNLPECLNDINIISAFCKLSTLIYIDSLINPGVKKRLLVRFLPSDISSGATDKEIFDYCINNNWEVYVDHTIHAKTYIFDKLKCILGSANMTNRGIGLAENSNKEISSFFKLYEDDYSKIMTLYKDSVKLDNDLYNYILSCCDDFEAIKYKKNKNNNLVIECLFPEDFPDKSTDIIELYNLRSFKWLIKYLKKKDSNSAFFGELANEIHNIFVRDPRPYRKEVKAHLIDLLSCINRLSINGISIIRPNYSECVILDDKVF